MEHPFNVPFLWYPNQSSIWLIVNLESTVYPHWSCFKDETLAEDLDEMVSYENACEEVNLVLRMETTDEIKSLL